MPAENIRFELTQRPREGFIRSVGVEPNSQQAQVTMVVVVSELERMVAGLINVESMSFLVRVGYQVPLPE